MPQPSQRINVELGEKESEGIYANLVLIQHSPSEFIIDFARILPGVPKAKVHARIVMTPYHTKLLSRALEENIGKFEDHYGKITTIDGETERTIGFQTEKTSTAK